MPKVIRKTAPPRVEPYSTIKPGDKPPQANKALAEKSSSEINIPSNNASAENPKPAKRSSTSKKANTNNSNDAESAKPSSFLEIEIPLRPDGTIACYDTCSTVRTKINALLGKDNKKPENGNPQDLDKKGEKKSFTKASFARAIDVSPRVLTTFLGAKRMMGGAESAAYPAAYAFFEKKRIFDGKRKTPGRLKVEENRPYGLAFRDPNHMRFTMLRSEDPRDFLDEYGQ